MATRKIALVKCDDKVTLARDRRLQNQIVVGVGSHRSPSRKPKLSIPYSRSINTTISVQIDTALIEEARRIGRHTSKQAAVTAALEEYVQRRRQLKILDLFNTIDFDHAYNYALNRKLDKIEER